MNWVTVIWSVSAGASLSLGILHLLIWLKYRIAGAHLAFAVAALAVTGIAGGELLMMACGNPADFSRIVRWIHLPIFVMVVAIVCFVATSFRTGHARGLPSPRSDHD